MHHFHFANVSFLMAMGQPFFIQQFAKIAISKPGLDITSQPTIRKLFLNDPSTKSTGTTFTFIVHPVPRRTERFPPVQRHHAPIQVVDNLLATENIRPILKSWAFCLRFLVFYVQLTRDTIYYKY